MTITATESEISYAGNGVTVAFAIPFAFDTSSDLKVLSTDSSGNVSELTTGWTTTGGGGSTGTLTFTTAPAAGVTITLLDDPDITQPTDYTNNDAFPADSHENALDRQTRISKRLFQYIKHCLRTADGDPIDGDGMVLGSVDNRKGKYLFFDAVTGAIEYAANIVTTTLSRSIIAQLLNPQMPDESGAGITPVNYWYPWRNLLRYSGIVADGVTDCTTAVLTVCNAMGGTFVLPYKVLVDIKTLLTSLHTNVLIIDQSQINDYTAAGETSKSVGLLSADTSTNDSAHVIRSGHHPGITLNNFGTAGTSSATSRIVSVDWAVGQHRNEGLSKRGARFGANLTFGKDGATTWSLSLSSMAPWNAIIAEWEFWITGEAISGAGVYRCSNNHHYVSTGAGTTGATAPSHLSGTVSDGGVNWTYVDDFDRNVFAVDQNGRWLFGSGAYTYQWNYIGNTNDPDGGQVTINWQAAGVSKKVIQRWTPTTAGAAASSVPFMEAQDAVGLRYFNSAKTRELLRLTETDIRFPDTQVSFCSSATAPDPGSGGTIATANIFTARVQPVANETGWILQAGTVDGQTCFVQNNAAFTGTFAAAATSNVADGATSAIPALSGRLFVWGSAAARWFRSA